MLPILISTTPADAQLVPLTESPSTNEAIVLDGQTSRNGLLPIQEAGDVKIRIAWGGGAEIRWTGQIVVNNGDFAGTSPLALTKDAPATAVAIQKAIKVLHRAPTNYGGVDIDLVGDASTTIRVEFQNADNPEQKFDRLYAFDELLAGTSQVLDDTNNQIWVGRVPGDELRFSSNRDHLVFDPGEQFTFRFTPKLTGLRQAKTNCRIKLVQAKSGGTTLWSETSQVNLDNDGSSAAKQFQLQVPRQEGVYDLWIELEPNWYPSDLVRRNAPDTIAGKKVAVRRCIQFVVVDRQPPLVADESISGWKVVQSFSPTEMLGTEKPSWSIPTLPNLPNARRPLNNNRQSLIESGTEQRLQLNPGGWLALPIDVQAIGVPHQVEIEFTDQAGTKLGVNVISPDDVAANYGMDSGVLVPHSITGIDTESNSTLVHRFVVWPKSKSTMLLITNRAESNGAQLTNVKVSAGPQRLTGRVHSASDQSKANGNRKRLAFIESPQFVEAFGAVKTVDPNISQPLDDWNTFRVGIDRLIQHLKFNQYQGAIVNVAGDGSAIYPSRILAAGPKFDSGVFLSSGQDPIRKDVLELMFRMFAREGLVLVPSLKLNAPLQELEAIRNSGDEDVKSFDLMDFSGAKVGYDTENLPIYNPLDRQVQNLVVQIVQEISQRYQRHQAFDGLALVCSPDTYTLLPGRQWAYDQATIDRFFQFSSVEGEAPGQSADRRQSLLGDNQTLWNDWRAQQMTLWYQQVSATVKKYRADGDLYLAPVDLYQNPEASASLSPGLHASSDFGEVMKRVGFDLSQLAHDESIKFLAPHRIANDSTLAQQRVDLNVDHNDQASQTLARTSSGALFVHRGIWAHFQQLEQVAPFNRNQVPLVRLQQMTPAGAANRRRFVHSIRQLDSQVLVDGGDCLPMGQDHSLEALANLFRQLPAVPFEDVAPNGEENEASDSGSLPVCVRQVRHEGRNYYYAVNDSPWPITLNLNIQSAIQNLSRTSAAIEQASVRKSNGSKNGNSLESSLQNSFLVSLDGQLVPLEPANGIDRVSYQLAPYSMVAGTSASQTFSVSGFDFALPAGSDAALRKHLHLLKSKLGKSTQPQAMSVIENPDFEFQSLASLNGWEIGEHEHATTQLETGDAQTGNVSLSVGTTGKPLWVRSNAFVPPTTGRISVSVWLKTNDAQRQPPLRMAIEGKTDGSNYYRFGSVGSLSPNEEVNQIDGKWRRFVVHFDDLPMTNLSELRVGFDLMAEGQVSIDNLQVYDRWFDENDSKAITQLLASAGPLLQNEASLDRGRRILQGYWPRFLDEHIGNENGAGGLAAARSQAENESASLPIVGEQFPFPEIEYNEQGQPINREVLNQPQSRPSFFQRFRRGNSRKNGSIR